MLLAVLILASVIAVALLLRDSIRHDRARRTRYGRRLSPGCFRCHSCDSHRCAGTCPVAVCDGKGGRA